HMTQALALKQILDDAGHSLDKVIIGKSERRVVPEFFVEKIGAPIDTVQSPNFVTDEQNKSINLRRTITYNTMHLKQYLGSLSAINSVVKEVQPDIIVSFYELMSGLYSKFYSPDVPLVTIGHQYMFFHPDYKFPDGYTSDRILTKIFTSATSMGAERRLALSYYPADDLPEKNIQVVPPLLREKLFQQPKDIEEDFLLIYLMNSGYGENVIQWHNENPEVELHSFWDNREVDEVWNYDENLTFHRLHDLKFLEMMARCKGLVCTAGFESISEGMYLNKPVFMIPTDGHFEQITNAMDAAAVGAGIYASDYDLSRFLSYIPSYQSNHQNFRDWVDTAEKRYLEIFESIT
ncbi:MAG: UDP- glucuronosyltransferase, partial [Candidatus Marinimicrobia bacterium]|nr:UDP- glucuronosyltransferase [Candidatus Neomarinimicrobiota bacterium]